MHSGLPLSILAFSLLRKNVKSWLFWNRHTYWMIIISPKTALSSAIGDYIANTVLHSSLPPEVGASWERKNCDICLRGWWEGDISHMPFLAAVMQCTNCSLWSCTYCATNPCPLLQLHQIWNHKKQQRARFFRSTWLFSNNEQVFGSPEILIFIQKNSWSLAFFIWLLN